MGSSNNKMPFANPYAQIGIALDKPYYYPGEYVNGKVLLMVLQPTPFVNIQFITKGTESTIFTYYEMQGNKKRAMTGTGKKALMNCSVYLAQFNEILQPGQYSFPFLMQIPADSPPTFRLDNNRIIKKAKVFYRFKAIANSSDRSISGIMSVVPLIIASMGPTVNMVPSAVVNENDVLCCCCVSKGTSKLDVCFEKTTYHLGEAMKALISVDNSLCFADVKALELKLMRRCTVISDTNSHIHASMIVDVMHKTHNVSIKKFSKSLSSVEVMVDPAAAIPQQRLQSFKQMPSCRGTLVDNFYILEVRALYNTTICCTSDVPESSVLIHLDTNNYCPKIEYQMPSNGWNPKQSQVYKMQGKQQDEEALPFTMGK